MSDDFEARSGDELNLKKGDRVELLELDDGFGDGWYLGKSIVSGVTGLFPGGTILLSHGQKSLLSIGTVYTATAPKLRGPTGGSQGTSGEIQVATATVGSRTSHDSTSTTIPPDDTNRLSRRHGIAAE